MTAKDMNRLLKKVADDTEILIGEYDIISVKREFFDRKMKIILVPNTALIAAPSAKKETM